MLSTRLLKGTEKACDFLGGRGAGGFLQEQEHLLDTPL